MWGFLLKFLNLVDEHSDFLSEVVFEDLNECYVQSESVVDVSSYDKKDIFNELDYGVGVFLPYNGGDDFVVQFLNESFLNIFGADSKDSVEGCLFGDIFPIYVEVGLLSLLQEAYESGESSYFTLIGYSDEDLSNYYKINIVKFNKTVILFVKDESELYLVKEKNNKLFHGSDLGIIYVDSDLDILNINKTFVDMLGFNLEEFQNLGLDSWILEYSNYNFVVKNFKENVNLIISGKLDSSDAKVKVKSNYGGYRWLKSHVTLLEENIVQITCSDITASIKLEETALVLQDTLNTLFECTDLGVLNINNDVYYWSENIAELFEIDSFDLNSSSLLENCLLEDSYTEFLDLKSKICAKKPYFNLVLKVKTKNNGIKNIDCYFKAIKFKTRRIVSWVGIFRELV